MRGGEAVQIGPQQRLAGPAGGLASDPLRTEGGRRRPKAAVFPPGAAFLRRPPVLRKRRNSLYKGRNQKQESHNLGVVAGEIEGWARTAHFLFLAQESGV